MRCQNCSDDLGKERGTCTGCGSLTLSVCITPRITIEFGLATSLAYFFLGSLALLLGQWPLADVLWLGTRIGEVVSVFGLIAALAPVPMLFVTSLVALRQLEHGGSIGAIERGRRLESGPAVARASIEPATPTERFGMRPQPSVTEHTTLRLAVSDSIADEYDLPTTRPN